MTRVLLGIIVLMFLLIKTAFGAVIIQQLDNSIQSSTTLPEIGNVSHNQRLGSGLTGLIKQVNLFLSVPNADTGLLNRATFVFQCFSDSAYSINANCGNGSPSFQSGITTLVFTQNGVKEEFSFVNFDSGALSFNSSLFYEFRLQPHQTLLNSPPFNSVSNPYSYYGSTSQFQGNSCDACSPNIGSYYFIIYDTLTAIAATPEAVTPPPVSAPSTCNDPGNDIFQSTICNVLSFVFIPQQANLNKFATLSDSVKNKPPFGYFTSIKTAVSGLDNGVAPATLLSTASLTAFSSVFTPLKTGFGFILFFLFGFWLLHRIRQLEL